MASELFEKRTKLIDTATGDRFSVTLLRILLGSQTASGSHANR